MTEDQEESANDGTVAPGSLKKLWTLLALKKALVWLASAALWAWIIYMLRDLPSEIPGMLLGLGRDILVVICLVGGSLIALFAYHAEGKNFLLRVLFFLAGIYLVTLPVQMNGWR